MFKLPNFPSPTSSADELADFAELIAWKVSFASSTDLVRYLSLNDDNINAAGEEYEGCEDQEDEHLETLETVFTLLGERKRICGEAYPFELDQSGSILRRLDSNEQAGKELYLYLLCATRLNMNTKKMLDGIDGALLMEDVCSVAIGDYLGTSSAQVVVLGTASCGGFKERVTRLLSEIREPGQFQNIDGDEARITAQDDGVDVVGWVPFADAATGKLSVFAQVKTGTNWRRHLYDCQPEHFMNRWLTKHFIVRPLRAFCIAESLNRDADWNSTSEHAGILFDRCRIVSSTDLHDFEKLNDMRSWLAGAQSVVFEALTPP